MNEDYFAERNMSVYVTFFVAILNLRLSSGIILRGARAREGQFPWLVQFQTIVPCGGILVSPDWVLTAAQCVEFKRNSITLYAAGLNGTEAGQILGVKATYIHPEYQAYSTDHDYAHNIALLKLVRAFDICDDAILLPDIAPVRLDDDYKSCLIFGWQSYVAPSTKVLAKPIQYSQVILNPWKVCAFMFDGNASYDNVFCTVVKDDNGIKACAGNPGSPVVCEDRYRRMVLLGIASWANFSLDCGSLPTYLGVSVFRSWLHDLVYDYKETEERGDDNKKSVCKYKRYFGGTLVESDTLNYSRTTQLPFDDDKQLDVYKNSWKLPISNLAQSSQKFTPRVTKVPQPIYPQASLSSKTSADISEVNAIKDRDDNFKEYREIGQSRNTYDEMGEVVAVATKHGKLSILNKPTMNENQIRSKYYKDIGNKFENLDDLELAIFNYEDSSESSSQLFVCSRYIIICCVTLSCVCDS